jgi:hypothetical protein
MTTTNETPAHLSLSQFTMAYVFCLLAIIGVTTLLKFEVPSAMGIISLMAAASAPAQSFVMKHQRVPTKSERNSFAIGATLISIVLSLALTAVALYATAGMEGFDWVRSEIEKVWNELPWLVALLPLLTLLISWLTVYFGSGFIARQGLKAVKRAA